MFYVTGDTHGNYDIYKLSTPSLNKNNISLTSNDYLIICGDFGLVWNNSPDENYWLDWLNEKPCITLFVDGNHENSKRKYQHGVKHEKPTLLFRES